MINDLAIGKRLGLGFGLVVAILLVSVGIAVQGFRSLHAAMNDVEDQNAKIVMAKDAYAHALQAITYTGALTATGDPTVRQTYLDLIKTHREAYVQELDTLKAQSLTEETRRQLEAVATALASAREGDLRVLSLGQAGKSAEAMKVYAAESCPKLPLWSAAFDQLNVRRQERMAGALGVAGARIRTSTWAIVASGALAVLAAAWLGVFITRSIRARPSTRPCSACGR
jgi:methyl-accepting chemotaxis protein